MWTELNKEKPRIGMTVLLFGICMPYRVAYVYSDGFLYGEQTNLKTLSEVQTAYSHWMELLPPNGKWLVDTVHEHLEDYRKLGCYIGTPKNPHPKLFGIYFPFGCGNMTESLIQMVVTEPLRYLPVTREDVKKMLQSANQKQTLLEIATFYNIPVKDLLNMMWR